ncbi:MAG: hypothetical protein ACRC9X_07420 [Bacteroidales bacterium]
MKDNIEAHKTSNEELDLLEIVKVMANWVSNTFWFLTAFFVRRFFWLLGSVFFGVIVAFGIYYTLPSKDYNSSAIIVSNSIESSVAIELLEQLNNVLLENPEELVSMSQMSVEELKKIKKIHGYYGYSVQKKEIPFVYTRNPNAEIKIADKQLQQAVKSNRYFKVEVVTTEAGAAAAIEDVFQKYLLSLEYVKKMNALRSKQIQEQLVSVEQELTYLHRAFEGYLKNEGPKSNKILLGDDTKSEISALQECLLSAEKRKRELEELQLLQQEGILSFVSDFSMNDTPSKSLLWYLIISVLSSLGVMITVLFFMHNKAKLQLALNK